MEGREFNLRVGESLGVVRILSKQTASKAAGHSLVMNKAADETSIINS
jgi:hypothetical protein